MTVVRRKRGRPPKADKGVESYRSPRRSAGVTAERAYEIYAGLGDRRSPFMVHRTLEAEGKAVSLATIKRWCKEQGWETKIEFAERSAGKILVQAAAHVSEFPDLRSLTGAAVALEDINSMLGALAKKVVAGLVDVEIKSVQDLADLARIIPDVLRAAASVRGDLVALLPGMARNIGTDKVLEGAAELIGERVANEQPGGAVEILEPVPGPSGLTAALDHYRRARQNAA